MSALSVTDLNVAYGPVHAVVDASFELEPGRICGLVGMNGSGKSSLIKAIVGTVRSQGAIAVFGEDAAIARKKGLVGYVPQNEGVDWDFPLPVDDVVMMGRYGLMGFTRRPRKEDRLAVDRALEMVDLTELRRRPVGELSGGQRKRVFIARAIAQGAQLLLLDEPFAGVDKPSERTITSLLKDLASSGVTLLVATHDLVSLPSLADEALLLMREVVYHGDIATAMLPDNLNRAFGVPETPSPEDLATTGAVTDQRQTETEPRPEAVGPLQADDAASSEEVKLP